MAVTAISIVQSIGVDLAGTHYNILIASYVTDLVGVTVPVTILTKPLISLQGNQLNNEIRDQVAAAILTQTGLSVSANDIQIPFGK